MAAAALRRQTLEVGAVCPNRARTDLCGGRLATAVPTANAGMDVPLHAIGRPASEKRQGTKSPWGAPSVPRALWGFGRAASGWARLDRCTRADHFTPGSMGVGVGLNRRSALQTGLAMTAGRFIGSQSAGVQPAESQPDWRASVGWWIGGDGIMRCRS